MSYEAERHQTSSPIQPHFGSVILYRRKSKWPRYNEGLIIVLPQTIDDAIPETKQTYVLQLSSVTGGASIDPDSTVNQATVVVIASDNPHGIFEFTGPLEVTISEDLPQVRRCFTSRFHGAVSHEILKDIILFLLKSDF